MLSQCYSLAFITNPATPKIGCPRTKYDIPQTRNQDTRILCVCVGGGGGATETKVDQTTEMYF